ncbi:pali-domain-containing protein [Phlegmacium glaucopus]|nr:pali-domain-containing protein [Phlegmacium glaucopus]
MGCIRPATPGFLVTLTATILLAIVSFCVPFIKSVFFLRASITEGEVSGSIIFGTLGYCLELSNGTTCSKPSIGYELDINGLVGNKLPIKIPQVVIKWITYALVLHIVALAAAAGSAVFGLLAHVREMSMVCCSTCISGFAAVIAMLAFIFDLVLFFVAKARINSVGSAQIGSAIWLTLAAWVLLFFSGCFYSFGRCCINNRSKSKGYNDDNNGGNWRSRGDTEMGPSSKNDFTDQRRLDAVKAEADRKAYQKQAEIGLPRFPETQPLTATVYGDQVYLDDQHDEHQAAILSSVAPAGRQKAYPAGGYAQAAPGTRAMDDYYGSTHASPINTYPPQRQASSYAPSSYTSSNSVPQSPTRQPALPLATAYGSSPYGYNTTPSPAPVQMPALPNQYAQDPYGNTEASYFATPGHEQQTSTYSQYNSPYGDVKSQSHLVELSYNPDQYNTNSLVNPPMPSGTNYANLSTPNPYLIPSTSPPPQQSHQPERSYTLGGDSYGASSQPPLQEYNTRGYYGYNEGHSSPPPINTNTGYMQAGPASPVRGPRTPATHDDLPPGYEIGTSGVTGNWGKGQRQ